MGDCTSYRVENKRNKRASERARAKITSLEETRNVGEDERDIKIDHSLVPNVTATKKKARIELSLVHETINN